MSAERDLLRRLASAVNEESRQIHEHAGAATRFKLEVLREAEVFLAAPEVETVWAQSNAEFYRNSGTGKWSFVTDGITDDPGIPIRVAVPAHLLNPPILEGEVVSPEVKP